MEEDKTTQNAGNEKGTLDELRGLWKDRDISLGEIRKEQWGRFAGVLSNETAEALLKYVEESRNEWEERVKKQFG